MFTYVMYTNIYKHVYRVDILNMIQNFYVCFTSTAFFSLFTFWPEHIPLLFLLLVNVEALSFQWNVADK